LLPLCSGLMRHTLQALVRRSCGLYICSLEISRNMSDASQIQAQQNMSPKFHRSLTCFKINLNLFMKNGRPNKKISSHCWRELMHGIWKFLLNEDFLYTYKYGIVVQGPDQIEQRIYPWIITYSADYPKKLVFYFCFQLVPLLTTFIGYCWPLSMIRAFAHAHIA